MPKEQQQSVRDELIAATELKQARRESDEEFLVRLAEAVGAQDFDSQYKKLSKDARAWADEAVVAFNDKKDIPGFPDEADKEAAADDRNDDRDNERGGRGGGRRRSQEAEDPENNEGDSQQENDMARTTSTARGGNKSSGRGARDREDTNDDRRSSRSSGSGKSASSNKTSGKSSGKSASSGKSNGAGKSGGLVYVRELLCKDPNISVADLADKVANKGYKVSTQTLHTTRSGFRQDVKALQEAGLMKRALLD